MSGSSSWKTQRIQDHFVVLCNELDVDRIAPVLRAERLLTTDEFEQLTNRNFTTQNRRQKLLLFIPRKGRAHFEKFGECLVWSGQSDLARKIGVPVDDIRPSPHPPVQPSSAENQMAEFTKMIHMLSGGMGQLPYPMRAQPPSYAAHPTPISHQVPPGAATTHPMAHATHPALHATTTGHPFPTDTHQVPPPTSTTTARQHASSSPPRKPQYSHPPTSIRPPFQATRPAGFSHPVQDTEQTGASSYQFPPHPRPVTVHPDPTTASGAVPDPEEPSGPKKNVFILYCNDEQMGGGGGGDFSESVSELADFLTRVCGQGTRVHCDLYLTHPPSNWTRWTERQIRESDTVLLVCSQTLKHMLDHRDPHRPIPMKQGHFDAETVYNLIHSPKFIPVFVNHAGLDSLPDLYSQPYRDWVPSQILGVTRYWLDLNGLHGDVRETSSEEEYQRELARALGNPTPAKSVEPIFTLLRVLQGVSDTQRPTPFSAPIIPPIATLPAELSFTEDELLNVANHIPQDWQTLGIKLGLMFPTLENIRFKHMLDVQSAAMEMFEVWRREKGEQATRTALRDALVAVGYGRVADEVFGNDYI